MEKQQILVVDDDHDIVAAIAKNLESEGYEVWKAFDGMQALEVLQREKIYLVILDIMMPNMDGMSATIKIREERNIPIILLSAKSEDSDKVLGLTMGADDYITKPFGIMELISRVKALLRRSMGIGEEDCLTAGEISLDGVRRLVCVAGQPCDLTYKEYELLKLLLQNRGIVMSRDIIMERIWDISFEGESRTLDVHIKTLRQKLGSAGALIRTVRNVGYKID